MPEVRSETQQRKLSTEGVDPLLLAGVNDANLMELARVSGCRVVLRDDQLILSGKAEELDRAIPLAEHLIDLARMGLGFTTHDISRFADTIDSGDGNDLA